MKQLCGASNYLTKAQLLLASLSPAGREHHFRHGEAQIVSLAPVWELTGAPRERPVPIEQGDQVRDLHTRAGQCFNSGRKLGGREVLSPCRFLPDGPLNAPDHICLVHCKGRALYYTIQNQNLHGRPSGGY